MGTPLNDRGDEAPAGARLEDAVLARAAAQPDAVAIDDGARQVTYGALAAESGRLASALTALGVRPGDRVGFHLDNGIAGCVAIVAILRAGAAYVPLNPTHPSARTAMVLEDARLAAVVTSGEHLGGLLAAYGAASPAVRPHLIVPDLGDAEEPRLRGTGAFASVTVRAGVESASASPGAVVPDPADVAYVMFTSGTTGRPKGVMVTHANVRAFLAWALPYFALTPQDRMSGHSSLSFDLSVFDVFGAFHAGATLCPVSNMAQRLAPARFMWDLRLTVWFSVPSVLGLLLRSRQLVPGGLPPTLRVALVCGEALPPEYAKAWLATQRGIPLVNLYGPTEATIACTFHDVGRDLPFDAGRSVPIGRPCTGTAVLILGDDDAALADGETGRLVVAGPQVAAGYFQRPDLTARAFRERTDASGRTLPTYDTGDLAWRDPAGHLHFVGRRDTQVKVRGYRVELGEVEVALGSHPLVGEGAVIAPERGGERTLLAFVAPAGEVGDEDDLAAALLEHVARLVPPYMVPADVRFVRALPRNDNGKVDRRRLEASLAEPGPAA